MSDAASPNRPAWAQARYERQLERLSRIADVGELIISVIEDKAKAIKAGEEAVTPETQHFLGLYAPVARAIRLPACWKTD